MNVFTQYANIEIAKAGEDDLRVVVEAMGARILELEQMLYTLSKAVRGAADEADKGRWLLRNSPSDARGGS